MSIRYGHILWVETHSWVGLLMLSRPAAMNALNDWLLDEQGYALLAFDSSEDIGCMS